MAKIVFEVEMTEDVGEGYTHYEFDSVRAILHDIPTDATLGIVETLAQSDFGTIGFPYGFMNAIDAPGETIKFDHRS